MVVSALIVSALGLHTVIAQDLTAPQNTNDILRELDKVNQGAKLTENKRRGAAIAAIQGAAASGPAAVDLYLRSLENTKYLETHQDYVDWSRKHQELLHSISFQNAAQLQMRYLDMALQRNEKHDAFAQIPECLAYLDTLSSQRSLRPETRDSAGDDDTPATPSQNTAPKKGQPKPVKNTASDRPYPEALSLINQPVDKSSVVQWLQISDLLPEKDFEPSAGNYKSIMEKNIRGPLRTKSDPRLLQTWDMQIARETATATESNSRQAAETFNKARLPDLLFLKAKDTTAIGQPNRALGQVMVLVRNYPENSSLQEWIETARGLITNPPVTPPAVVMTTNNASSSPSVTPLPATPAQ
jgi:hypothetical protein